MRKQLEDKIQSESIINGTEISKSKIDNYDRGARIFFPVVLIGMGYVVLDFFLNINESKIYESVKFFNIGGFF